MGPLLRPGLTPQLPRLLLSFGFLAVATAQQGQRQTRAVGDTKVRWMSCVIVRLPTGQAGAQDQT